MTLAPIQGKCPVCHQDSANTAFQAGAASRDAEIAELDAANKDAKRYRFIRDNPWNGTDLESVITCHLNAVWDLAIDEAIRTRGDMK